MVRSSGKFHGKQTRTCRINGLLNLPCAYLNTQGISQSGTPLKRIQDGNFIDIIIRYSLKFPSLVQYFLLLGNSIFLNFRAISNKLKKVVSIRVEMCIKSSIC
ncbi:hypothetical protein T03_13109 [Trichinella britovi]|uniref:Uncharacterized protein n=1 Tax=Trichinella britovi TaxID=45882 RepID=A0A0V1C634_TRIBR|nr:hypothetical protein T03_13109 [Trichinella britovi]